MDEQKIAQENRNAAQSNLRTGKPDRRRFYITNGIYLDKHGVICKCRRKHNRRAVISSLELQALLIPPPRPNGFFIRLWRWLTNAEPQAD